MRRNVWMWSSSEHCDNAGEDEDTSVILTVAAAGNDVIARDACSNTSLNSVGCSCYADCVACSECQAVSTDIFCIIGWFGNIYIIRSCWQSPSHRRQNACVTQNQDAIKWHILPKLHLTEDYVPQYQIKIKRSHGLSCGTFHHHPPQNTGPATDWRCNRVYLLTAWPSSKNELWSTALQTLHLDHPLLFK